VLALGDDLELALVEPRAAVGGALQDGDTVQTDWLQRRAAARAVSPRARLYPHHPVTFQTLDSLPIPLLEVGVLFTLLLLPQALAETILAVYHRTSCDSPASILRTLPEERQRAGSSH